MLHPRRKPPKLISVKDHNVQTVGHATAGVAERRNLLLAARSTNHHRKLEETLQHQATTQCIGLPPTSARSHHPDGPKADHALTFKLDHSSGAAHHTASDPNTTDRDTKQDRHATDDVSKNGRTVRYKADLVADRHPDDFDRRSPRRVHFGFDFGFGICAFRSSGQASRMPLKILSSSMCDATGKSIHIGPLP